MQDGPGQAPFVAGADMPIREYEERRHTRLVDRKNAVLKPPKNPRIKVRKGNDVIVAPRVPPMIKTMAS